MAPEQIEKPLTVDHRADIYSLGVVFYEMLTGELPLGKFQPPSAKVQMDVRLDEVVLHALEKEPERRYQQASEVKTHVETIASTSAPGAAPAVSAEEILARDYTLNIRHCLRRGWALVRNDFWPLVGMSAFVTVVLWPAPRRRGCDLERAIRRDNLHPGNPFERSALGGLYLYFLKKIRGRRRAWKRPSPVFASRCRISSLPVLWRLADGAGIFVPDFAGHLSICCLEIHLPADR